YLKEQAKMNDFHITAKVADLTNLTQLDWLQKPVDLLTITYYLERSIFTIIDKLVKEDGYLFIETFYQTMNQTNHQISDRFKLEYQELLTRFKDWRVILFEENEQSGRQTIFCQKRS